MKKIFFLGTPQIAVPTLEVIASDSEYEVFVGVFPDKKVGRKQLLTPCPVKSRALELDLKIVEISNKKDLVKAFETQEFDLAMVIAFGMIFPKSIFELRDQSDWDIINVHFSLLPEYRGASPVQAAILDGKELSGISWQRMVYQLDEGDLLAEASSTIVGKSCSQLWDFFAQETARHTPAFLSMFFAGKLPPVPQQQIIDQNIRQVSICGMFEKSDGDVDPSTETAEQIYRKYLAFDVWPGIQVSGQRSKEEKQEMIKLTEISLEASPNALQLVCADGNSIYVSQMQLSGKRPMTTEELLRGFPELCLGERKE